MPEAARLDVQAMPNRRVAVAKDPRLGLCLVLVASAGEWRVISAGTNIKGIEPKLKKALPETNKLFRLALDCRAQYLLDKNNADFKAFLKKHPIVKQPCLGEEGGSRGRGLPQEVRPRGR